MDSGRREKDKINVSEMYVRRRMKRIKWEDGVSNEEILKRIKESRVLLEPLRCRRCNWVGHKI